LKSKLSKDRFGPTALTSNCGILLGTALRLWYGITWKKSHSIVHIYGGGGHWRALLESRIDILSKEYKEEKELKKNLKNLEKKN
jgi:hypothetical protein